MTKYRLQFGDDHGLVVDATPDADRVVWRSGVWDYVSNGEVDEDGHALALAKFT